MSGAPLFETTQDTKGSTTETRNEDFRKERTAIIAELCFMFLPFVVILIINLTKGDWAKLLQTSDWALAATLLFGQTIVKMMMGVASQEHSFNYQLFGLITALIIVFGLVPSITVISIFQISPKLSTGLVVVQFILLGASISVFIVFGTIGQVLFSSAFKSKISKLLKLTA